MKFFRQFNSVFHKLIISYVFLVIAITFIIGSSFYFFFTSRFNHEVEQLNQKMLEQTSSTITTKIIETAISNYMNLVTDFIDNDTSSLFRFDDTLPGNHIKLFQTQNYLQKIVSNNSSIIHGVHIFYKDQNIIISSSLGIKYLNEEQRKHYRELDWIKQIEKSDKSDLWIGTRVFPSIENSEVFSSKPNTITYVRTYPIISNGKSFDGLIAIDIKESVFSDIIKNTIPSEYPNTFIINSEGTIISHDQKDKIYTDLSNQNYIQQLLESKNSYGSAIGKINNVRSMISYTTLPHTEWKLINIKPLAEFYKHTSIIKQALLLICLLVITFGIMIASIFTKQLYNPLSVIFSKTKKLLGSASDAESVKENEYNVINHALDDLSFKVNHLQTTLLANKPIIKHNLIMSLLHHQIMDEPELEKRLHLINLKMEFPFYTAITLKISLKDGTPLDIESSHFIKYSFIDHLENYKSNILKCIAVDLSGNQIGIIIASNNTDQKYIDSMFSELTSYMANHFMIQSEGTMGTWVHSLLDIHKSFNESTVLFKYMYFYPNIKLLRGKHLLERENSTSEIPIAIIDEFLEGLHLRNLKEVEKCLDTFVTLIQEEPYSADYCQQKMVEIVHTLSKYTKKIQYELLNTKKQSLYHMFNQVNNIEEFKNWVLQFATEVFNYVDNQSNAHDSETILLAKNYIYAHLEEDLSLDRVSEHINISPAYLSKLFKDETGINFVSFIKDLRLEKATTLLLNTDLSVKQIGSDVGYNTTAYFIRQFKAKYGYTPNDFRKKNNSK